MPTLGADSGGRRHAASAPRRSRSPGVYVGVITGWGADTLAGPLVRLATTVVVPYRDNDIELKQLEAADGGQWVRVPFAVDSAQPFTVRVALRRRLAAARRTCSSRAACRTGTTTRARRATAIARRCSTCSAADAMPGNYELVVQASQFEAASVNVSVLQSPGAPRAHGHGDGPRGVGDEPDARRRPRRCRCGGGRRRPGGAGAGSRQCAAGPVAGGAGMGARASRSTCRCRAANGAASPTSA